MRKLFLLFSFLISMSAYGQTVLWYEDFESESNGAVSGNSTGPLATTWHVIQAPSGGTFSRQNTALNNRFTINNTGANEGVWSSGSIDISAQGQVALEMTLVNFYTTDPTDYVKAYYKVNGGTETLLGEIVGGGDYDVSSQASVIISGNTVEIIVRARENTPGNSLVLGLPIGPTRMMRFDDVRLVKIGTLYSLNSTNWSSGTTWATDPLAVTSCGCTPNQDTHVVIRHAVNVNGNGEAVNITVQPAAQLRWTGNFTMSVVRGGTVSVMAGGSINRNGHASATIDFNWPGASNNIAVALAGSINIGFLTITNAASVNISGAGSITVLDDLLINTTTAINSSLTGGLSIGDDLNFNTTNASLVNSGTITVVDIGANDDQKDGNVFTNSSGGTLNITNVITNNADFNIINNGTINQTGNFPNNTLDVGSSLFNGATGVWNWSYVPGAAIDASLSSVLNCSTAGNTFNYSGNGNQTVLAIQYSNLTISTSGTKSLGGHTVIGGNLSVQNSAILNCNTRNITLGGDWSVALLASFTETSGLVTFNGATDQYVTNLNGETFNRVTVNKTGGSLTLNNNVTITGNTAAQGLTLTQGIVNTSALAMLTLGDDVTSSSGNATSFVNGPMRKIGDDGFIFPVGKGTHWARIRISNLANATSTTQFTAQYFTTSYLIDLVDATLHHASVGEYWMLDRGITDIASATVTLYWEDSFSDINSLADLTVAHFNGISWVNAGKSAILGNPTGPGSISSAVMTSFSPFTFGSIGGTNPLPVELTYFNAILVNDKVQLKWETASEKNNDFFTVQKTSNPESFEELLTRDGQGTSTSAHVYTEVDLNPYFGLSYYRLMQTDFDGTSSYSDVQVINYTGPEHAMLRILQNPVRNDVLKIRIDGLKNSTAVPLVILNAQGQLAYSTVLSVTAPGSIQEDLLLQKSLSPGVYIVRAGPTRYLQAKIIVE